MGSCKRPAPNILVLGIGNIIMSDDGVGARIVQELQREYHFPVGVEIVDGGTLGLDLLPLLEGRSHLIMVDAVETGKKPGSCVRLTGEELPIALETKLSPHQMGLKDLLAVARLMGHAPAEMVLIGVQPCSIDVGAELTAEVSMQVESMKGAVLKELERMGAHVKSLSKTETYRWDQ
ncbi:MAG TPA: hydrogenase expression/formation protein [Geobacter sp.]|nr:hydrogenase expression/formation protein [Geobacter sp.]